jgi:hypothetical protein
MRRSFARIAGILALLWGAHEALAQDLSGPQMADLFQRAEPCVVHLTVTGAAAALKDQTREGSGVVIRTGSGPTVMTAQHVVGADSDFDPAPGSVTMTSRNITLLYAGDRGPAKLPGLSSATANPTYDVSQVYLNGWPNPCLPISTKVPALGDPLLVVSWPTGAQRPRPTPVRVNPGESGDGALIRVDHGFVSSESGSPVLNGDGVVVGIVVVRDEQEGRPFTLVLPTARFNQFIPQAATGDFRNARWAEDPPMTSLPPAAHCGCLDAQQQTGDVWTPLSSSQPAPVFNTGMAPDFRVTNHCTGTARILAVKDTLGPPHPLFPGPPPPGSFPPGFQPIPLMSKVPGREFSLESVSYREGVVFRMNPATGIYLQTVSCPAN